MPLLLHFVHPISSPYKGCHLPPDYLGFQPLNSIAINQLRSNIASYLKYFNHFIKIRNYKALRILWNSAV